jgi:hypothetical protein
VVLELVFGMRNGGFPMSLIYAALDGLTEP